MPSGVGTTEKLDFLAEVPWLVNLQLLDTTRKDVQGIQFLTQLKKLYRDDYSKQAIDFRRFPHLEDCHFEFSQNKISVARCTRLNPCSGQHYAFQSL